MRVAAPKRVALALMLPVALIAGGVFSTAQIERNAALLSARRAAASELLLTSMLNQETGARGFFATRDPLFLLPWAQGTQSYTSSLAQLRSLVAGDVTLTDMVDDQARASAGERRAVFDAPRAVRRRYTGWLEPCSAADAESRAFQMISQRCPSRSRKYPE